MAKKYELVLIIDPQVGDTQLEAAAEKYKAQLEAAGAEVLNVDKWGLRKMAYTSMSLRQRQQGYYLLYQFEGTSEALPDLEAALKLDDAVLRHLFVAVQGEFVRVPTLAPENIYIYNPPERPRDRRGPRRDRDDRRDDRRGDGPPGRGDGGREESRSEAQPVAVADDADNGDDGDDE